MGLEKAKPRVPSESAVPNVPGDENCMVYLGTTMEAMVTVSKAIQAVLLEIMKEWEPVSRKTMYVVTFDGGPTCTERT